jgi:hypothetical protein
VKQDMLGQRADAVLVGRRGHQAQHITGLRRADPVQRADPGLAYLG